MSIAEQLKAATKSQANLRAPNESETNTPRGRSVQPGAVQQIQEEAKSDYVFNFNDIPQITTDLRGIKSLETTLFAAKKQPSKAGATDKFVGLGPAKWDQNTLTQPKGPGQDFGNLDQDRIRDAFSKADFLGIRSLPNAMEPNFRQQLYHEVLDLTKRDMERQSMLRHTRGELALMANSINGAQQSVEVGNGQKAAGRFSALPDEMTSTFSTYVHMHTPVDAMATLQREELAASKAKNVNKEGFSVRVVEMPLDRKCAFSTPERTSELYVAPAKIKPGTHDVSGEGLSPWNATGRAKAGIALKCRAEECIDAMTSYCAANWPMSFKRLFEDKAGCIVVAFDVQQAEQEGDVSTFMNQMSRDNATVVEFMLQKDSTRWGVMQEEDGKIAYYVFWPPWVTHVVEVPEHLGGPQPRPTKLLWESRPPLPVDRVPFMLGNPNCLFDDSYVPRVEECTFRT